MITRASLQFLATVVALLLALWVLVLPGASDDARALETESSVPGQIVVKLAPGAGIGDLNLRGYGLRVQERFLNQTNTDIYLLRATDGASAQSKLNAILGNPLVTYAELNYLSGAPEAGGRHRAFPAGDATPSTRNYSKNGLYSDSALNLTAAREISQGAGMTVAVLDTGAQLDHPALKKRVSRAFRATTSWTTTRTPPSLAWPSRKQHVAGGCRPRYARGGHQSS